MSGNQAISSLRGQLEGSLEEIVRHIPGVVYQYQYWPEPGRQCFPYASEGIRAIYGISPEEAREDATSILDRLHPEDAARVWQSIVESANSLEPWHCEYRVLLDKHRIEWLEGTSTPARQPDGSILWHGFISNISERKRRERQMQRFSQAMQATKDAVTITDRDGIIQYVNHAFTELTGYPSKEAVGHTAHILQGNQRSSDAFHALWKTLLSGQVWKGDLLKHRKDGSTYTAAATISPIMEDGEECTGFVETQRDVTEGRQAQAEIAGQKAHLSAFVQHAPVAIAMFDNEMRYIAASQRWLSDYSMTLQDIIGRSHYEVFPDMSQEWKDIHSRCLAGGAEHCEDDSWIPPGWDHPQHLRWDVRPWRQPEGSIGGIVMLTEDITQRKRMEQDLREATTRAEQHARTKSEFLANMSHEIRTPLNAIVGMSEILSDDPGSHRAGEYVETIRASSDALLVLINDILDFSKIESGQMEMEIIPLDLRHCVETAIGLVNSLAEHKHIDLHYLIDDDVPPFILGDAARLRQVFINLLNNAVKFTETGEVFVTLHRIAAEDGPHLRVSVRDTGIGIPADRLDRLFQSFSQVDASTTRRFGGTGLGLAISHRIITLMGGRIWVESSSLDVGSDFQFDLPLHEPSSEAVLEASHPPGHSLPANIRDLARDCPLRILVAEDNLVNQRVIALLLERFGYQITLAANGLEVLAAIAAQPFDVILMDIQMPVMDGLQTTRELIRRHPPGTRPRIIALTADAVDGDRELCLAAGMDDYLSKPIRTQQLAAALRSASATRVAKV